ncbi:Ankyrin repeatcontaining protein [Acanthamoeba castellanii str. Neff]|uniref:Ankyrin repeatcontaining protein n=1 Tax=Acanthamoeba castellanii (strain ATCC 30010 / Neff) TaxID=1257118 RepID=L8HEH0_ACACF|nr:Ankyrin repeatcontaining protein [Acanthamoeba castellanii str. Neff]ELR22806.1 Ankyrin repeatcontaining protein [Acanthamoeba castellanii str. Neff]
MAKELLESIKKAASIDQAFQAMHGNAAQKAAFLELRPLHALVRSPPITGSFNATMAEKVLSFFANQTPPIIEQESAEHYTPLMQVRADINKEVSWQNTGWFVTRESHTPLRLACKHAQVALTQLLLERGADATKIDTFFSILRNTALSHADKMALGMALLPYTNLTNHWAQLLVDLLNSRALPLFQKLLTLDDKIKEWKFLPNTSQDPLIQLIEAGGEALPEWIDELLRNGHKFDPPIDVNATRSSNGTPVVLLSVVRSRSAAVIKTLIKHGADPNARDESGQDIIDELLAAGADIFAVDPGNTALGYALVYERWDAVDRLLTDANLDEPIQWLLRRPILRSDKEEKDRDRARLIQKRLAAGKKPPRRNYEQENELYELVDDHATCSVKAQEYQRLAGVNSKMLDVRGKTPLLFCVAAGRTALVKRILARRPELSWQTCNIAADWPGLASRYEGMRVDISPAALAALHGQAKAFGLLFKHADGHLDVNAWMEWDRMRQQCIHAFLKDQPGDEDALQALSVLASLGQPVEMGADPLVVDNWGNSPLALAAHAREWDICRQLISAGANINAFYQPPRKGSSPREHKQSLIGILARGIPVAPEHMYELITSSHFDFVYHLLKKLRAENKLQSYLSAQQCKGPLFALTKLKISDSRSKPAQKVLKALFAAVKDYGCTARNERGDTFLTALAREQQTDADSAEDSAKMSQTEFASLTLALIAHGADLAERNVDGDTFFHVVARDYQSTELLKSFLAAIDAERAQRLAQPQTSTSTMAAAAAAAEAQKMEGVEGGEADMDVEFEAAAAATKPESAAAAGEEEKNKLAAQPEEGSLEARVKRALEVRNGRGQTPLLTAVRPYAHAACRNTEVMSLLLALGANPQDREQGTGNTALFYAVMTDNQAGVRKLLELGLDINGVNDKGETPLFVAGRQNLWKMTLFLLLSGANPHAINEAGECVLLASSGFCAAIIHDFVARPRSLSFIVSALFPELVAGLPNHRPAASPTEGATSTSAANEPAIASTTTPTPLPAAMTSSSSSLPQVSITDPGNSSESAKSEDDSKAKEEKNEKGNENEEEQEAEEASKTLLDNFPEILHQLNDGDTTTAGGPASGDGLRKREQNKRQRMNAAVKQVTELLRRVLDALQLYEGALDEADVAPDSGSSGDQGDEQHRRARWERNASLTRLKEQLAGWLRKSEARIPRITRNLSFTTLSEGEMALYLRQWKSLRRQRNQRKRKRGEEVEEDFFAETSSQPQEEWIDVKRPRLEGQGQGEDSDGGDLPMPPLTVPEVESIPLPPPFVLFDDAVPFDALAPLLIRRTRSLVVADAKSAIPDESNSGASYKAPDEDDDDVDDSVDLDDNADKTGVDTGVGLLAEEGYLLDAFLTKVDDVEQSAKLQALFVRSKVTMRRRSGEDDSDGR